MLFFLRKIRKTLLSKYQVSTYLLYAVGEIVLVVVGILIAVAIDDANQEHQENEQQIQYYNGILTDLKKDSLLFSRLYENFRRHLENYYATYREIQGGPSATPLQYEYMMYTRSFAPVTQKNHQITIDKIKDISVRGQLNEYFTRQEDTQTAISEFSKLIVEDARPYFLKANSFDPSSVFHEDVYGFLPKSTLLIEARVKEVLKEPETLQLLMILRIAAGQILDELDRLRKQNALLIEKLQELSSGTAD